jgi:hypothetical protein
MPRLGGVAAAGGSSVSVRVALLGLEALTGGLVRSADAMHEDMVGRVKQAAKIVRDEYKGRVNRRSGQLAKSASFDVKTVGRLDFEAEVGPKGKGSPPGHLVESGTVARIQTSTGRETGVMPAFHPLQLSVDATTDHVFDLIGGSFEVL